MSGNQRSSKPSRELAHSGDTVRVVQLTDTHLQGDGNGKLLGMDTDRSLQAVLDLVRREQPVIDLVLGTGDLSNHGERAAYERLLDYFAGLEAVDVWLPGNHDNRELMLSVAGAERLPSEIRVGRWQIVMLDSQLPGRVGGHLGHAELDRLQQLLSAAAADGLYSLVCLHHQPVPIGCSWLDQQMVADATAFFSTVDAFPAVRGVLWGHVHQQYDRERGAMQLMSTPSTCVQFRPGQRNFSLDDCAPGYRWLELHADGRLHTGVSRVRDVSFEVDLDSNGYL
ncbi:MAG: 3',5'-cyclic-AMP phosphodiesterase [Chromatocurvus sp.]